ncbi:hypothetical protein B9G55_18490 [Saccharibacillus sp. O16]|nr:hypothetical protein B9G55_18490 [Saccharibacillus sp. O16]
MNGLLSAFVITALAFGSSYSAAEVSNLGVSPASQPQNLSADIHKKSSLLSDAEAKKIADDLKSRILKEYGQKYDFANFMVEFSNEKDKGEVIGVDVSVNVDMTLTQDPAQSADSSVLNEAKTHYNVPSNSWFLYHVEVEQDGKQDTGDNRPSSSQETRPYHLFIREDITSDETILTPLE